MKHPTTRLRLGSVLFGFLGAVCALALINAAAVEWIQFQGTRAVVAAELGRMP
jgi:hypothetical protein